MTNKPTLEPKFLKQALAVAQHAAKKAEKAILQYYQDADLNTEVKEDQTPVTVADKMAERIIRGEISTKYPDHSICGEEFGKTEHEDSEFLWLIDPIDGTKSFVRKYPFFSTQIALMYHGELVLGVSNAPIFEEMAWATIGGGAFLNNDPIKIADEYESHTACISTGNIQSLVDENWQRFGQLLTKFGKIRGYGDFYHYHLLASGKIDLVIESDINILDIAALTVVVREAGGIITDLNGKPIDLHTSSILAGTQQTHKLGLTTLNE